MPVLADALKDQDAGVRRSATGAVGRSGRPPCPSSPNALKDQDAGCSAVCREGWEDRAGRRGRAVPALIDALKDQAADVRELAAEALGNQAAHGRRSGNASVMWGSPNSDTGGEFPSAADRPESGQDGGLARENPFPRQMNSPPVSLLCLPRLLFRKLFEPGLRPSRPLHPGRDRLKCLPALDPKLRKLGLKRPHRGLGLGLLDTLPLQLLGGPPQGGPGRLRSASTRDSSASSRAISWPISARSCSCSARSR